MMNHLYRFFILTWILITISSLKVYTPVKHIVPTSCLISNNSNIYKNIFSDSITIQIETINYDSIYIKGSLGLAYEKKGNYQLAAYYYKELATLLNNTKDIEQQTIHRLTIACKAYEKRMEFQKQHTQLLLAWIMFASGVILYFCYAQQTSNVPHYNISKLENEPKHPVHKESTYDNMEEEIRVTKDSKSIHMDIDENGRILFEKLESMIMQEKLFLNPELSREKLMKLIHVDKNRLGKILQQYAGTNTVTYINNKRLEYSVKLLKESPQYTIIAIGELCGIPNPATFNRLFKNKYGVTPSKFRQSNHH